MNGTGLNSLKVSPRDILFILFSKLYVGLGVFFVVVLIVFIKILTAEPLYRVHAALLIKPMVDSRFQLHSNRYIVDPVSEYDVNSEIKLILSKELMKRVVDVSGLLKESQADTRNKPPLLIRLGIDYEPSEMDKAISSIRNGLDVSPVTTSHIIRITKTGSDPVKITKLVNTIVQCYITYHIEARKIIRSIESYRNRLAFHEKKIYEFEEAIKEFQKRWFLFNIEEQYSYHIKRLQTLQDSLQKPESIMTANSVATQTEHSSSEKKSAHIKYEIKQLKEKELELNRLTRKLEQHKRNYTLYIDKIEEARIVESRELAGDSNIFVSNWASEPSMPFSPNKKLILLLMVPTGVIAGIGAAFAAFYLDHTVKKPEDAERCSGGPVFASLRIIRQ